MFFVFESQFTTHHFINPLRVQWERIVVHVVGQPQEFLTHLHKTRDISARLNLTLELTVTITPHPIHL